MVEMIQYYNNNSQSNSETNTNDAMQQVGLQQLIAKINMLDA